MLGSLLQNIGPAAKALLQGFADGLLAFKNPAVLLGAANLGGSIAIIITTIGAGIAAASWIMGKALPSLSEGINSFTNIDGDKLVTTAKGITALGGALVAFSATSSIATVGNTFNNIIGGMAKFFGGEDIVTKISNMVMRFSPMVPQLTVLGPAIQGFGSGLLDFSKAINSIDLSKGERVRELLASYASSGALKAIPGTTPETVPPAAVGTQESSAASVEALNKTMAELLKYTKEMAENTKRTMDGVKALNPNLFAG